MKEIIQIRDAAQLFAKYLNNPFPDYITMRTVFEAVIAHYWEVKKREAQKTNNGDNANMVRAYSIMWYKMDCTPLYTEFGDCTGFMALSEPTILNEGFEESEDDNTETDPADWDKPNPEDYGPGDPMGYELAMVRWRKRQTKAGDLPINPEKPDPIC